MTTLQNLKLLLAIAPDSKRPQLEAEIMTREDQIKFVRDLTANVAREIIRQIEDGRIPYEWNGIELRVLLAARFEESAAMVSPKVKRQTRREMNERGL